MSSIKRLLFALLAIALQSSCIANLVNPTASTPIAVSTPIPTTAPASTPTQAEPAVTLTAQPIAPYTITAPTPVPTETAETAKPNVNGFYTRAGGLLKIKDLATNATFEYSGDPEKQDKQLQDLINDSFANAFEQVKRTDSNPPLSLDAILAKFTADVKRRRKFELKLAVVKDDGNFSSLKVPEGGYKERTVDPSKGLEVTFTQLEFAGNYFNFPVNFILGGPDGKGIGGVGIIIGSKDDGQVSVKVAFDPAIIKALGPTAKNFALSVVLDRVATSQSWNAQPNAETTSMKPLESLMIDVFSWGGKVEDYYISPFK